jgi:hypothetical protein
MWCEALFDLRRCDSIVKVQSKLDYLRSLLNDQVTFKSIYRYAYDFALFDLRRCDSIVKVQSKLDYLRSLLNDQVTFKSIYRYAYDFARVSTSLICL